MTVVDPSGITAADPLGGSAVVGVHVGHNHLSSSSSSTGVNQRRDEPTTASCDCRNECSCGLYGGTRRAASPIPTDPQVVAA